MLTKFVKLDDQGRYVAGELLLNDLPDESKQWCAEFVGAPPVGVPNPNYPSFSPGVQVAHTQTVFVPSNVVLPFALSPSLRIVPSIAGFYKVHHRRRDRIYGGNGSIYNVQIRIGSGSVAPMVVAEETVEPGSYQTGDMVEISGERLVYCNGTTDQIFIQVAHNYNNVLTFSSTISVGSETHSSVYRVGSYPESAQF